jgi:hypothetical protein
MGGGWSNLCAKFDGRSAQIERRARRRGQRRELHREKPSEPGRLNRSWRLVELGLKAKRMKKICWADVEHTETPGSYPFLDGTVDINERHIEIWKSNPAALFQVTPFQGFNDAPQYALGSWE